MICRIWRGWTTHSKAGDYQRLLTAEVIPNIEKRNIAGFQQIDIMRREVGPEVEFATIMWFDHLDAVKSFAGHDYEVSHVPPAARKLLLRYDERASHYHVLDRRKQRPGGQDYNLTP